MKFSVAAVLAVAAGVMAHSNVTYTTEVVTSYETYCPGPTVITYSDKTYTITSATTLTITDCPCTVTKPVTTSSIVKCHTCGYNATSTLSTVSSTGAVTPTKPPTVPTAGAGKAAALSGAGLAGVLGLAAFIL